MKRAEIMTLAAPLLQQIDRQAARWEVVGALRRGKETATELHVVVEVGRTDAGLQIDGQNKGWIRYPYIVGMGRPRLMVIPLNEQINAWLYAAIADNWGYVMINRTGSQGYVGQVLMPRLMGHDIMFGNDFPLLRGKGITVRSEADLFALAGLDYVEPSHRDLYHFPGATINEQVYESPTRGGMHGGG